MKKDLHNTVFIGTKEEVTDDNDDEEEDSEKSDSSKKDAKVR